MPHVILRPFCGADRAAMRRLLTSGEISRTYMLPDFDGDAAVDALFDRFLALSLRPDRFVRAIEADGALAGFLNETERADGEIELGWAVDPALWNRGIATAAVKAAIGALFAQGLRTVRAGHFAENAASRRVMEKCGMRPTGRAETIAYRGRGHTCHYLEIRAPEKQENGDGASK